MCGIAAWLQFGGPVKWSASGAGLPDAQDAAVAAQCGAAATASQALSRRGPDSSRTEVLSVEDTGSLGDGTAAGAGDCLLHLHASVLHLRGAETTAQPVSTAAGGRVLFNGEVFGVSSRARQDGTNVVLGACSSSSGARRIAGRRAVGELGVQRLYYALRASQRSEQSEVEGGVQACSLDESDTAWLTRQVDAVERETSQAVGLWELYAQRMRTVLEAIHGPFSVVVWSAQHRLLLCARDKLGRRSLLVMRDDCGDLCVSSAPDARVELWTELPVTGLFIFDLSSCRNPQVHHLPWVTQAPFAQPWWWSAGGASAASSIPLAPRMTVVEAFTQVLGAAVARRVIGVQGGHCGQPRVGLLFSGGLDSTMLAALVAETLPQREPVELLNVAFHKEAPDRITALCSFAELVNRFGIDRFRLILVDVEESDVCKHEPAICSLLGPRSTNMDFSIAVALWFAARGVGTLCSPGFMGRAWFAALRDDRGRITPLELEGVLRSTQVAAAKPAGNDVLGCRFCRGRSKPRCVHQACGLCCRKQCNVASLDPTGSGGLESCSAHKVRGAHSEPRAATEVAQQPVDLRASVCGASAAEATWVLGKEDPSVKASSRVLLIGTGADELLGGYARHRTARAKRGVEGVRQEMMKDLERLWTRNLGRDDRIVADHGREARHPFLDDDVLSFIGKLPIGLLCDGPGGEEDPSPDKWMLRQAASDRGLASCARFKKRAIQFGSRIARQTTERHAGSRRQVKGDIEYQSVWARGGCIDED